MGNIITSVDSANYTGQEQAFQDAFVLAMGNYPALKSLGFRIEQSILSKKTFYKVNPLRKITKAATDCATVSTGTGVAVDKVVLEVFDMEAEMSQCKDIFKATIAEAALKNGYNIHDLTGTQIETLLLNIFGAACGQDLYRQIFLNDTTLTNNDYTAYDGVYKKLATGANAADGTVRVASSITDTAINSTNIVATLNSYYDAQPSVLKYNYANADKRMYVTDPIYRAWENKLSELGNLESSKQSLVDGVDSLKFRGIPMVNLTMIDQFILEDFSTTSPASTATDDNRIILTNPTNHIIGTNMLTDAANAEFWYERKDKTNYARVNYKAGYAYVDGRENVIGGF